MSCTATLEDPRWIEPTGSRSFVSGYLHGCQSGRHEYNDQLYFHQQSQRRYMREDDYRQGWDEGFELCYAQEKKYPTLIGGNSEI